jgi:hypothetical protein
MPLEKIPAILLVGYGIHMSMTVPTPWTPKNERRGDGPVEVNWFGIFLKVSNFAASQTYQLTYQGRMLDLCNHRNLHHPGGNNEDHLVKGSYNSLVAKR